MNDGDAGFMGSYDKSYTSRDDTFADTHNLDQCISYLNQSLDTFGFPSGLNLFSNEPASIVQTCNCLYALIQQRQRDVEYRLTADETRLRLMSDVTDLEAKVKLLTDQLASKEREILAIERKLVQGSGSYQEVLANVGVTGRSSHAQSQPLRHDENGTDVVEKAKLDNKIRHLHDIKLKTPIKAVTPRSPLPPKTPAYDRLCPYSPPTQSVKRILAADCAFTTPRSRFSEQAGMKDTHFNMSASVQRNNERLKKTLKFESKKAMDVVEKIVTSTSEERIVQCSGSLKLPDENIFLSPLIQYDNPIYQEESPPLSERLKTLELNMRALSPISVNVEHLQRSSQGLSPWKSNISRMNMEFEKLSCDSPERETILNEQCTSTGTPEMGPAQADPTTSGSLTPFQQLKNPDFQKSLVNQYLLVLNTATREELLELKGIGPKRAAAVLELRQHSDEPFKDLQDLKNIGFNERQALSLFNCNIVKNAVFPTT